MSKYDADKIIKETMSGLKDFQRATVERICYLYKEENQRRVLVADEVGMGKTLVARGVIAQTAKLRQEENDQFFKVVYICSNVSIANQNIDKLNITNRSSAVENIADNRLSMQHLTIRRQEYDPQKRDAYIQFIPLTPETSFRMTSGGGISNERALMYVILTRIPELSRHKTALMKLLKYRIQNDQNWKNKISEYRKKVNECDAASGGVYPADLIVKIQEYNLKEHTIDLLLGHLRDRRRVKEHKDVYVLQKLRNMFARISTQMLEPDLVIMDEFQRFKFLIGSDEETEAGILANQFLKGKETRVLLLSATPYKLYSTLDEIEEAGGVDEHYSEFMQVMNFLFEDHDNEFISVWENYNKALHEMRNGDTTVLYIKNKAEDAMYRGMCRTERISVMESGDYTEDFIKPVSIDENDIKSYLEMGKLLENINANFHLRIDYVKSSPFLMSFMKDYREKRYIENYFMKHPDELELASNHLLWVNRDLVRTFKSLPKTNGRFEKLKEVAFKNSAELYLWVPPSKPYYDLQGPYRNGKGFSKVLVFSSWEMVPRMISSLISYEFERRTVGKVCASVQKISSKNKEYSSENRYPYQRLVFRAGHREQPAMTTFCLLYPSRKLASLYNPILSLNAKEKLPDIERRLRQEIKSLLAEQKGYENPDINRDDAKWYYLAPMLMDDSLYVWDWTIKIEKILVDNNARKEDKTVKDKTEKAIKSHLSWIRDNIRNREKFKLGRMPENLTEILVNMALGSPAVCIYRSNMGYTEYAIELAKLFLDYFNTTESTAVIQLASEIHHTKRSEENTHWQDVLQYCKDGCFQAMFDEYRHIVSENVGFLSSLQKEDPIYNTMIEDLRVRAGSSVVDTYDAFSARIKGGNKNNEQLRMRTHYAMAFANTDKTEDQVTVMRKENIRGAFNSPLRPFVLATTSIGQEGLDFHNYCRRVMHWNLPSNPIDLEQREGRVNRFKCLAVRQSVAEIYGDIFCKNSIYAKKYKWLPDHVWPELFKAAEAERGEEQSELIPYWCFGKNQKVKIERIIPMYPMSRDQVDYERMIKILSLYRITMGHARQAELLEYLFDHNESEELKRLFIDLSPFTKEKKGKGIKQPQR